MKKILFLASFIIAIFQLSAQKVDTIYVYETKIEYDTVVVYDTLWVHDTLHLQTPDSATLYNVLMTDTSTTKSVKKHDLFKQRKRRESHQIFQDEFFDGLHFGYLAEVEWAQPTIYKEYDNKKSTHNLGKCGWQVGLELSYNFAKYFGVSAALNYGYLGSPVYNEFYEELISEKDLKKTSYGLSMPLKFEFHCPIASNVWFAVDAGARLRAPFKTFAEGFTSHPNANYDFEQFLGQNTETQAISDIYDYSKDAAIFNVDLLLDAGFYFKLPNSDLLRTSLGLNYAFHKFATGSYYNASTDFPTSGQFVEGVFYSKNNHLALQLAYMHTFQNQKIKMRAQPHWNDIKLLSRHEFRLEFSDPSTFTTRHLRPYARVTSESSYAFDDVKSTPIFAFGYHYRIAKWFWIGMNITYHHSNFKLRPLPEDNMDFNTICLMPDVRFSYLNRPHCTLYSAAGLGLAFVTTEWIHRIELADTQYNSEQLLALLPTVNLTAFGVKAGANHWFGSAEIGYGYKGFASVGVGYEF